MKNGIGSTAGWIFVLTLWVVAIGGWILNIVKFVDLDFTTVTGMMILRGIGIFMAPLGAVLGYL